MTHHDWTRENIAWLAGLLEGEGSFIFGAKKSLIVQLQMTDGDVVKLAHSLAGVGRFHGPYDNTRRTDARPRKESYMWTAHGDVAYAVMVDVLPKMGDRRRQRILEVIALWKEHKKSVGYPSRRKYNGAAGNNN